MATEDKRLGVIEMLLDGMPAWQKSILTLLMVVPIVLALSGLILQVNVGSIIQAVFNEQMRRSNDKTVDSIRFTIAEQIKPMVDQMALWNSRLDQLERRTEALTKSVNDIKIYVCDTDAKVRGNCPLLRP